MGIYAFAVAISVPGVQLLAVIGGWLFGWLHGTIYVAVAATIAASAVFLLARSALAQALRERAGPAIQRFADGFRDHAPSYVFVLHLVPVFPYAVVNTLPAACGVRLRTFVLRGLPGRAAEHAAAGAVRLGPRRGAGPGNGDPALEPPDAADPGGPCRPRRPGAGADPLPRLAGPPPLT